MSGHRLRQQVQRTISAFNAQVADFQEYIRAHPGARRKDLIKDFIDLDATRISWTLSLKNRLAAGKLLEYEADHVVTATYRPFFRQQAYFDHGLNHIRGQMPRLFPSQAHRNVGFYQVGAGSAVPFAALILNVLPDLHVTGAGSGGQFFPRWTWEAVDDEGFDFGADSEVLDGFRRVDNITEEALRRFTATYGEDWTKDDVFFYCYGLLHSPDYRTTYAADLKKMLPRIPFLTDPGEARAFADAGRRLSELHLGYESVEPYPLDGPEVDAPAGDAAYDFYAVGAKKMRFGDKGKDRTALHYNDRINLSGIPAEAYRYQLGSRSAIEWIIDRYYIRTDKPSGIVNDPNDWSREIGDPRYILDLLARIVTVSLETMQIVDALPPLAVRTEQ